MPVVYTANATAEGAGRQGKGYTDDERLTVDLSVPKGMGGDDGPGTNPEQLFAIGYAACFHGALKNVVRQAGADAAQSSVHAEVSVIKSDGFGLAVKLVASLPGLDQAQATELVEKAHQVCPYSKATRGNIEVEVSATV
ncbi:Ohr subfamily peroxiredoxin [Murinocardiopsis flavida]|uniref:Ohr subfamily peroxiredoxin n=2 Tax=Murinocardiopsis flavida TaxID=645275 RepID=A0A2P8D9A7_9ACTN|nr:organic hydroperoxide resistance protein [Murinocardiopsis flavida]PSK93777.1 Ohr subfamily peroxiredoxin [Murinocardiopsis flavida]